MNLQELLVKKQDILHIAKQHGAYNVRVFGSVARGEANDQSDLDFLVDIGDDFSPWFPVRLIRDLEQLLNQKVDVVTENGLKARIKQKVIDEAISL